MSPFHYWILIIIWRLSLLLLLLFAKIYTFLKMLRRKITAILFIRVFSSGVSVSRSTLSNPNVNQVNVGWKHFLNFMLLFKCRTFSPLPFLCTCKINACEIQSYCVCVRAGLYFDFYKVIHRQNIKLNNCAHLIPGNRYYVKLNNYFNHVVKWKFFWNCWSIHNLHIYNNENEWSTTAAR